jgi:putative transposase
MPYKGTRIGSTAIRSKECSHLAVEALDRNLRLPIQGSLEKKTIFQALTGIAAQRLSIHSLGLTVEKVPCETSFRHHLMKIDHISLEHVNHKILTNSSHAILKSGKSYKFAIDYTLDPYFIPMLLFTPSREISGLLFQCFQFGMVYQKYPTSPNFWISFAIWV